MDPRLLLFERHSGRAVYGDDMHRCRRCGGGPVAISGGDLSSYCLNCGNYDHSIPLMRWPFGDVSACCKAWIKRRLGRCRRWWIKSLGERHSALLLGDVP